MKIILTLLVSLALTYNTEAQGIFNQKAGHIKNLIKQISLLQVYIGYVEKGYGIAKQGLTIISNIKNGDLNVHLDNFKSLKEVNPKIKKYTSVAHIISLQLQIVQVYKKTTTVIKSGDLFNSDENEYVYYVFDRLLDQCAVNIEELITLTTTGYYEMKDNERLARIDILEKDMEDKYAFAQMFSQGVLVMAIQTNKVHSEVFASSALLNIKKP